MLIINPYWWSDLPDEIFFMEITRRDDVGADLKAPHAARGGTPTPGYALVNEVAAGSIIVHYDSAAEQIVGVSRATGERTDQPIWWAARGSYARRAAVKPQWLPGTSVTLTGFRPLERPLSMPVIRRRRDAILAVRENLQTTHPGQALYFPWNPYQDSIRTFQTYLAKFPRAALDVLPEVADAVSRLLADDVEDVEAQPEVESAERDLAVAAGRPRPRGKTSGQGFSTDQKTKVAVETHAMNAALAYYSTLGTVTDTSRTASYDYVVQIGSDEWHVEVKGTTGDPTQVLLTPNEVEHALVHPHVALFILGNVQVIREDTGDVRADGGNAVIRHPWTLDNTRLTPIGYKYRLD